MAAKVSAPAMEPFDPKEDPTSLNSRWTKLMKRFKTYLLAENITDPTQKRALLLYLSGLDVPELSDTLPETGEDKDFDVAVKKLTDYFAPKQNTDFEIYKFRQAIQSPEENLEAYYTRLRKLAATCNFENPNEEIKRQIIQGCTSSSLRRHALKSDKLTLTDLLAKGKRAEVVSVQAKIYQQNYQTLT